MLRNNPVFKWGIGCLLSVPVFFIIPFIMTPDDTTWGIALGLWGIGFISLILGIILLIISFVSEKNAVSRI